MSHKIDWDKVKKNTKLEKRGTLCFFDEKEKVEKDQAAKWLRKNKPKKKG